MEFSSNFSDIYNYHVMQQGQDNVFYDMDEIDIEKAQMHNMPDSPKSKLSLSISRPDGPDWSSMLNAGEKSLKITDTLLDTPEILSQCVDWQLHNNNNNNTHTIDTYLHQQQIDANSQITAIKNELTQDYTPVKNELQDYASCQQDVPPTTVNYYTAYDHQNLDQDNGSSRAGDGSVSPALSEAPSSMAADDERYDSEYVPGGSVSSRGRRGRKPQTKTNRPQKRKLSDYDKNTIEYQEKRKRNNIAVRKSRDKAKRHHFEIEETNRDLQCENAELKQKNESLVREVSVLRKLITDIGKQLPNELSISLDEYSNI